MSIAGGSTPTSAPTSAPAASEEEIQQLDPVEVTGSIIKRAEVEGPAPVKTIPRTEIEESGRASFADFMLQLPEAGYSSINEAATGDVRGANVLNLRGFNSSNTLILVDSRPAVLSGITASRRAYIDLNRFPAAMVERVEILQDSGAIYGSGAAAGVVNIILRKDFSGTEVTARYGNSLRTDVAEKSFSVLSGFSNERSTLTVGLSYYAQNALLARDTTFANNADLTDRYAAKGPQYAARVAAGSFDLRSNFSPQAFFWPVPGQYNGVNGVSLPLASGYGPIGGLPGTRSSTGGWLGYGSPNFTNPAIVGTRGSFNAAVAATFVPYVTTGHSNPSNLYNTQEYAWLKPQAERSGVNLSFRHTLSAHATVYARFAYQHNWNRMEEAPSEVSPGENRVPKSNYWNPFGIDVYFYWRPVELGPLTSNVLDQSLTALLGVRGNIASRWQWDTAYSFGKSQNTEERGNCINKVAFRAALAKSTPDALNVFGGAGYRNDPAVIASFRDVGAWEGKSLIHCWDARLSGDLLALPSGALAGGLFAEVHRERFFEYPMTEKFGDLIGGAVWDPIPGNRTVQASVGELHLPLIKRNERRLLYAADLSASVRFDHYSEGYDSGLKPYAGLRVQPARWLTLRTSMARTFLAPTLVQLYGRTADTYSTGLADLRRPQALTGDPFDGTTTSRLVRVCGNPNLRPGHSKAWQYGLVADVPGRWLKGLTAGATYFHLEQSGAITVPSVTLIRQNEVGGGTAELIVREPGSETYTNTTRAAINILSGPDNRMTAVLPGQTVTVPGRIAYIMSSSLNFNLLRTQGCDFSLGYVRTIAPLGRFQFRSAATYTEFMASGYRPAQLVNYVGRDYYPRLRMRSSLSWARGDWSAVVVNNYVGPHGDLNRGNRVEIDTYSTFDASISRRFKGGGPRLLKGTRLTLGVDNALDREPPLDYAPAGYRSGNIRRLAGRFVSMEVKKTY